MVQRIANRGLQRAEAGLPNSLRALDVVHFCKRCLCLTVCCVLFLTAWNAYSTAGNNTFPKLVCETFFFFTKSHFKCTNMVINYKHLQLNGDCPYTNFHKVPQDHSRYLGNTCQTLYGIISVGTRFYLLQMYR